MRRGEKFELYPVTFRAAGLAAIGGLRSMAAPALLSRAVRRGHVKGLQDTKFMALGYPKVSGALQLMMVGEMVADKTPFVPSRTSPPALLGRAFSGALVGAALFVSEGRHGTSGAVLGALCAAAAAYTGERLRAEGAAKLGLPDLVLAFVEDGIVLFGGTRLLREES